MAGRLAPSPTGLLHLGNARTFLAAWVSARARGLPVLLRVEDIDGPRVKPGLARASLDDLAWLGLTWDGEPLTQSERLPLYADALERLKAAGLVYPCTCSRKDVEQAASAPHAGGEGPTYPGTCAGRTSADAAALAGRPFAWRFRVADSPAFEDAVLGPTRVDLLLAGGDFVVWKNDGRPAYQLAVAVDDAATGVTEVVRGDDLVSSTPRQLLIYRALGRTPPRFAHVPLVVGPDGRRLAKRHGDTSLAGLRQAGVAPGAVVGFLAWSLGWRPAPTPASAAGVVPGFDWSAVPRGPFRLDDSHIADFTRG